MSDHFISREQAESDLLAAAAYIGERIKSSDGHSEAMNAVVPRYLANENVDLAAELANAVDDPFSRDKLLIEVAVKCAEINDDEYALQLADTIEDHGLQAQAFERIGRVKAGQGNVTKAGEIAEMMSHPDFVFAAIAVDQATNGDAAAGATLKKIEFSSARVSALQQIAAEFIEADAPEKALDALDNALAAADEIEHEEEKIRAFCDIGNHFLEAKRNDRAVETFDKARGLSELLDNTHRDFFLVNCALGFLYAGSGELADRALDQVTDKTQMASALLGFARQYWKNGEKEDAIEALEEAFAIVNSQKETETRDSRGRNVLLASIASQFAGFGKTDRGVEIALENPDPAEQMAALSQIAQILTVQKEDDLARQTINLIGEDVNRLFALIAVSDEKEKLGDNDAAIKTLEEAATLSETVPQLASRSSVLNEIAVRFVGYGIADKARSISLENLNVISMIRDESSQAVCLAALSDLYREANLELVENERQTISEMARKADN